MRPMSKRRLLIFPILCSSLTLAFSPGFISLRFINLILQNKFSLRKLFFPYVYYSEGLLEVIKNGRRKRILYDKGISDTRRGGIDPCHGGLSGDDLPFDGNTHSGALGELAEVLHVKPSSASKMIRSFQKPVISMQKNMVTFCFTEKDVWPATICSTDMTSCSVPVPAQQYGQRTGAGGENRAFSRCQNH